MELLVELLLIVFLIGIGYSVWRFLLRPAFVAEYKAEMQEVINSLVRQVTAGIVKKDSRVFQYNYQVLQILRDHAHEVTYLNLFFLDLYERKYGPLRSSHVFELGTTESEQKVSKELRKGFFRAYNRYLNRTTPLLMVSRLVIGGLNKVTNGLVDLHGWLHKKTNGRASTVSKDKEKAYRRAAWNRLRKFSLAFSFSNADMLKEAAEIAQSTVPRFNTNSNTLGL